MRKAPSQARRVTQATVVPGLGLAEQLSADSKLRVENRLGLGAHQAQLVGELLRHGERHLQLNDRAVDSVALGDRW